MSRDSSALSTLSVRTLFFIDALGAAVTALMLGVVLRALAPAFGLPPSTLLALALVAVGFAAYSLTCWALDAGPALLLAIAAANSGYCVVTLALIAATRPSVTTLGALYFAGEALVIAALVVVEVYVARRARAGRAR